MIIKIIKILIITALLTSCSAAYISCDTAAPQRVIHGDPFISEGWFGDNAYRLTATGVPGTKQQNKVKMKDSAKKNAISLVLRRAEGEFHLPADDPIASSGENRYRSGVREMRSIIKTGSILKVTFDEELSCEVVYEISAPGLKKKAEVLMKMRPEEIH